MRSVGPAPLLTCRCSARGVPASPACCRAPKVHARRLASACSGRRRRSAACELRGVLPPLRACPHGGGGCRRRRCRCQGTGGGAERTSCQRRAAAGVCLGLQSALAVAQGASLLAYAKRLSARHQAADCRAAACACTLCTAARLVLRPMRLRIFCPPLTPRRSADCGDYGPAAALS